MAWDARNEALHLWQKEMISLRKRHESVRNGVYRVLAAEGSVMVIRRQLGEDCVTALFNTGDTPKTLDLTEAEEPVHIPPHAVKIIERP